MQLPLTEEQTPPPAPRTVTFEQPLSERLRMFLRLEFLYQQAKAHCNTQTTWGMRAALQSLLEILAIISRGDPKAEVIKELERRLALLREYQNRPGVDANRLHNVMHQIKDKIAEIRVKIPKRELFVKQTTKSFEESFDMAIDSVLVQIKRVKEKQFA